MLKKALPILIVLTSVIFVVSCFMTISTLVRSHSEIEDFKDLSALVYATEESMESKAQDETDVETESVSRPVFTRNLTPLFERNSDCVGWICIPGTSVDYPFMHTPQEPQKYLRKNFDKKYSLSGIPFLQEDNTLDSDNLVIYGHNMKNGTMFSDLAKYCDKSHFSEHSIIEVETAKGLKQYEIFAVVQLKKDDEWYRFVNAADENDYRNKVENISSRALYDTGIMPEYGRQLVTLSTCYGSTKNDRIIVVGAELGIEGTK